MEATKLYAHILHTLCTVSCNVRHGDSDPYNKPAIMFKGMRAPHRIYLRFELTL